MTQHFSHNFKLTARQLDRAAGAITGLAAGDALGAGYEFGSPLAPDYPVELIGGNVFNWAPGEWTDDTSMAVPILEFFARGERCDDHTQLNQVVAEWVAWAESASDVGNQTRSVLSGIRRSGDITEAKAREVAEAKHHSRGQSAGNGSLMRTAPVSLGYLAPAQEQELMAASRRFSELTHWEAHNWEATALWNLAIRHAILSGEIAIEQQIAYLPETSQAYWREQYAEAIASHPSEFKGMNGWVVGAFKAAVSAIHHGEGMVDTLELAVRGGGDTDTVAAIAGSLIGAKFGYSSLPAKWLRLLHGWPGYTAADLMKLAVLAAQGGAHNVGDRWPAVDVMPGTSLNTMVLHPHDSGVYLCSMAGLQQLPDEVTYVVSLARVGRKQTGKKHLEFWLVDKPGENNNTAKTVYEAATAVAQLRAEGHAVALHCLEARSRTSAVAAAYSAIYCDVPLEQAWADLQSRLKNYCPKQFLIDAVESLVAGD